MVWGGTNISNKAFLMNYVHNKLAEDPEWGPVLASNEYNKDWMNFVYQSHEDGIPSIYDMYVYTWLHTGLCAGSILYSLINVGQIPKPDKSSVANNQALSNLPKPFQAKFLPTSGRGYNTDGELTWSEPIVLGQTLSNGEVTEQILLPSQAPLEVGSTGSHRTLMHLLEQKLLARWAYGEDHIRLVHVRDTDWNARWEEL